MGLDLTLIAVSDKARFILDKAKQNSKYAADFDKIQDPELLRLNLEMAQVAPDESSIEILKDLIEDSEKMLQFYPKRNPDKYIFRSLTRGYETLNYLLIYYLKSSQKDALSNGKVFYGGTDINCDMQFSHLRHIDNKQVSEICEILEPIAFSRLLEYYDFGKMDNSVYKLTKPERLKCLEEEFEQLKTFYINAKKLGSFVLVKIN